MAARPEDIQVIKTETLGANVDTSIRESRSKSAGFGLGFMFAQLERVIALIGHGGAIYGFATEVVGSRKTMGVVDGHHHGSAN